jgi:hypothetical protein
MSRHLLLLTVGAAGLALCACASAPVTSTWTAPGVRTLNPKDKTIAVVFLSRDASTRRDGEHALAEDLSARNAMAWRLTHCYPTSDARTAKPHSLA